jgi:hypothetical protein
LKQLVLNKFEKKFKNYQNMNNNNKNFIIIYKLHHILHNHNLLNELKHIDYKNLIDYITKNNKDEIIYINNFIEQFSVKEKEINNIINFKTYNNKKVKTKFVFFIKVKLELFYNNSYILI